MLNLVGTRNVFNNLLSFPVLNVRYLKSASKKLNFSNLGERNNYCKSTN